MSLICGVRRMKRWFSWRRGMVYLAIFAMLLTVIIFGQLLRETSTGSYDDAVHVQRTNTYVYDGTRSLVEDRFTRRNLHLEAYCKNKYMYADAMTEENDIRKHLLVDDKHKLVYCFIEKVGCTFWRRVFQILSGFKNVTDPFQTIGMKAYGGYKTAEHMPFYRINYIFSHSTSFLFVREPYERLLSGYIDKLLVPIAPYWLNLGRYIVEKFRKTTNSSNKNCGDDITFEEFVQFFIYSEQNNVKRDVHFFPNYDHCRPCELHYDYIGKLETFQEDTMFLLEEMKLNQSVQIKNFEEESERDSILQAIDWSYSVDELVDHCIPISERLFRTYRMLQIRGLISKDIPFPFFNAEGMSIGINEYKQAFLDIYAQSGPRKTRKLNRKEAFMEAYSSLSRDLLTKLQEQLSVDAEVFGYEAYPDILKAAETYSPLYRFFDIRIHSRKN